MKISARFFYWVLFPLLVLSFQPLHADQGMIKKVVFQGGDGTEESVSFHLNGPWFPKVFALKGENPRVVFDFMGVDIAKGLPLAIAAKGRMIRKIRLGRHQDKTRVVIDLAAGGDFNFEKQFDESQNILTIRLFAVPVSTPQPPPVETIPTKMALETEVVRSPLPLPALGDAVAPLGVNGTVAPRPAEGQGPRLDAPLLSEISFENTSDKGEMVLFRLNGFYPPTVRGEEEGTPSVICDFVGIRLGEDVVSEQVIHGEYIERVTVGKGTDPDVTRVRVELVANKNYDLQQVFFKEDSLFVIIVNSYDLLDKNTNK